VTLWLHDQGADTQGADAVLDEPVIRSMY
jgi:hypothetical protein